MSTLEELWDLRETSREEFEDLVRQDPDVTATLGDLIDEEIDIAVSHYFDRHTQAYVGTMRVTEDGTLYLVPDNSGDTFAESELYQRLYGA